MAIFTRLLGTSHEGKNEVHKYFAVLDSDSRDDVAIVKQSDIGDISIICECCVTKKYAAAIPILREVGRRNDQVKPNKGGAIDQFIQNEQTRAKPLLSPYYTAKHEFEHHVTNDRAFSSKQRVLRNKVQQLREQITQIEAEIATIEAEIPATEEAVRKHERIMAAGEPAIPHVEVVRLETLMVEGPEKQQLLFPETSK